MTWPDRFWVKVDTSGDCWLWTGARDHVGYGRVAGQDGRIWLAHRMAYTLATGPIPDDRPHLDHLCRVTSCVRPSHLEPVTQQENNRRQQAAKTHCIRGHPLAGRNLVLKRRGRECRICKNAAERRRYRRRVHQLEDT